MRAFYGSEYGYLGHKKAPYRCVSTWIRGCVIRIYFAKEMVANWVYPAVFHVFVRALNVNFIVPTASCLKPYR